MKKCNLPNLLTFARIVMIFVSLILATNAIQKPGESLTDANLTLRIIAFALAILAGFTDTFDGYLARKWHQVTELGALMDPLADKIFVTATMLILVEFTLMPCWIVAVVISREFMVTGIRMAALRYGVVISADKWGKFKTVLQMTLLGLGGLVWVLNCDLRRPWHGVTFYYVWLALLICMVVVTVLSSMGYIRRFIEIVRSAEKQAA